MTVLGTLNVVTEWSVQFMLAKYANELGSIEMLLAIFASAHLYPYITVVLISIPDRSFTSIYNNAI